MSAHALTWSLLHRRRARALFLTRTTQHVKAFALAREVVRALVALAALGAWGALGLLLAA